MGAVHPVDLGPDRCVANAARRTSSLPYDRMVPLALLHAFLSSMRVNLLQLKSP